MFATIKTAIALTTASIALVATGSAAFAGTFQSNGRTAEVRHGDLDLSSAAGQKALRKRISLAASKVCANPNLGEMTQCRAEAIANVRASVDTVVARAATGEVYADAADTVRVVVGN